MTPVLLDTGCIVALLDRSEAHHENCVSTLADVEGQFVTCEAVVAEACYLLRGIRGAPAAILENVDRGTFLIAYHLSENGRSVTKLMKRYANVPMDLADACLVDMAEKFKTGRILTLDRDFLIYRWGKNRPFELLLDI